MCWFLCLFQNCFLLFPSIQNSLFILSWLWWTGKNYGFFCQHLRFLASSPISFIYAVSLAFKFVVCWCSDVQTLNKSKAGFSVCANILKHEYSFSLRECYFHREYFKDPYCGKRSLVFFLLMKSLTKNVKKWSLVPKKESSLSNLNVENNVSPKRFSWWYS